MDCDVYANGDHNWIGGTCEMVFLDLFAMRAHSPIQLKMVIDSKSSRSRPYKTIDTFARSPFALCQFVDKWDETLYVYAESANIQLDHVRCCAHPPQLNSRIHHTSILWWNTNAHLTTITATFLEYDNNVMAALWCCV